MAWGELFEVIDRIQDVIALFGVLLQFAFSGGFIKSFISEYCILLNG